MKTGSNFEFLKEHDPIFFQLANGAEKGFASDPNMTLVKLRQLGEAFAEDIAARCDIDFNEQTTQKELLFKVGREIRLERSIQDLFHTLRREGNKAVHRFKTKHKDAMDGLKIARSLAVWYHQSFGKQGIDFRPGAFIPPQDPSIQLRTLQEEIEKLKGQLTDANQKLENNQQLTELITREKEEFAALAEMMDEEARHFEQQAKLNESTVEQQRQSFEARITDLKQQLAETKESDAAASKDYLAAVHQQINKATSLFTLNEELTRIVIDQQLIDAGWEADSQELTYAKGGRPEKGKNKAIAEWPTRYAGKNGRADYVLFAGLVPIAVVEAKKENVDVAGKIPQAERYSKGFSALEQMTPAWEIEGRTIAWVDEAEGHYHIPFVYSCNGRPYVKQLKEKSGTWFRDVRHTSNTKKPHQSFHSPDGLLDRLKRSLKEAELKLDKEPFGYLKLRDYQEKAVLSVEEAFKNGQKNCLLAMATGTGKTRTIISLMYRFLKAERFRRILFLVDRTSLGDQANDSFTDTQLEQGRSLSKIYNIAELADKAAEAETRIQVATVQAMVKRIFMSDSPPPIDEFDCIIIDEAHRGYTLDQEMTEGELSNRDASQYLSSYRRVLDYFDAHKIGLTATPALHTTQIFGKPVYTYSYREAVADDWLIDHEPPIRYETLLSKNGIKFEKGETVTAIDTQTGEVETAELEDEMKFDVESFNRRVITEGFNKVICEQLAQELDPFGDEKIMIFCSTDLHADMIKRLLDVEFKALYNGEYKEAAVRKITGQSDKVKQLIKNYKNERYPNIAITVDLLTTGIDVPKIAHLVFLRRVKSRILYEQMLGRATRRSDEIGKTVFKIYDPVDIYKSLEKVSTMKPIVKNPNISLAQLVNEITNEVSLENALNSPGTLASTSHADDVLDQINQKVMRVLRKAQSKAESNSKVKQKLDELESAWGVEPSKLHQHLHELGPKQAASFIRKHAKFLEQIESVKFLIGTDYKPIIHEGDDELIKREQSFSGYEKPEDYLEGFNQYIKTAVNERSAIAAVVNRPKDLTRAELKAIKLQLDNEGFSEANLATAWRNQTNQDIAASIIGYIRQAALGEALIPFEMRVNKAMEIIYTLKPWTPVQRKWLARLAKQLIHEVIIDRDFVNDLPAFRGGAKQLDKVLGNQLDMVLEQLRGHLWKASSS
ncbi:type I restriction-modification system endonuclease [Aliikangiella maris]|uniref:Type I restriction-modification system endonuclease n=2 Tax=Aliikangiella maris TaxID=3162458 RepID=A0ABV3MSI0_9GAMM